MKYNFILLLFIVIACKNNAEYSLGNQEKKIMVFGCFDLFHEGHKNFLAQASERGTVIAVITRDAIIEKLKKRTPSEPEELRLKNVQEFEPVYLALLGDEKLGTYGVLHQYKPDLICLGYDQQGLYKDLHMRMKSGQIAEIPMVFLEPYQENIYHTSIIRERAVRLPKN